jgi:4-hydroxy-2-oxoheptanedioate aldolase
MATVLERVRAGEVTLGTFLNLGSALVAEVCALSGFDWLLVDLEHGAGGEEGMEGQLLAGQAHDVPVFVRTETDERIRVGHALDLGADGIMFPRLDTTEQVKTAISHLWYPPRGDRGIATYNRARRFGGDERASDEVNDAVLGIVQIETLDALHNVEAIASTSGVDVVFVGPADLSSALGVAGQLRSPTFVEALERVSSAATKSNISAGILTGELDQIPWYHNHGYTFISAASDSALLRSAAVAATRPR